MITPCPKFNETRAGPFLLDGFRVQQQQQQHQTDHIPIELGFFFPFLFLLPKPHKEKRTSLSPSNQCPSSRNREPSTAICLAMVRKSWQGLASHDPN